MPAHVFFNPELVQQLATCGITARREGGPGFVLERRRVAASARPAVTNVVTVRDNVTITGSQIPPARRALPAATSPQTSLELVEECARLRRENDRLTSEISRLRAEVARLAAVPSRQPDQSARTDLDDAARRFALLELD